MGLFVISQPLEVEQAYRVKSHVAVIVDGERKGEAAVVDEVVVPFLYAQGACLDVCTAVDRQQLFGVAGLCELAPGIEQGYLACYLVLIHSYISFFIIRISVPANGSLRNSPSILEQICGV